MDTERREERKENPRASSNFISSLFLFYMVPIFYRSFKKGLTENDLFQPLKEHKSNYVADKLEKSWISCKDKYKIWGLHIAMFKAFGLEFLAIGILTLVKEVGMIIVTPILIGKIVSFFSQGENINPTTMEQACIYSGALVIYMFVERTVTHPAMMWIMHVAMKLRVSCCSLVYRKTLKLSRTALAHTTVGHVVNLISNDVSKFDQGFVLAHYAWVAPIQTAVGTYFLYREIGVSAFLGLGFLLLILPVQMFLAKRTSVLRLRTALRTDERVRLMNEIISGIQVIKMYTWEKPFAKLIAYARRKEMNSIRAHKYIIALTYSFETFVTRTAIFISLVSCFLMGETIDAQRVFAITAIYNVMRTTVTFLFSISISSLAEVNISIKRIKVFLDYEELPENILSLQSSTQINGAVSNGTHKLPPRVSLKEVNAKWDQSSSEDTLSNVNFTINNGELYAVIGPVGSGKSSLLNVLLRELPVSHGEVNIHGTVSFSSQEPWLFSASVRQNILFGEEYDEERYKEVCKVCALESDFAQLPYGDKTLVGEKGKALSGGQKARINLARCVYKKADIYLLDDPLSAVDTHVGKQLFNDCIKSYLAGKIVILITHQLQYLKNTDAIVILKDGTVNGLGTYKEMKNSGLDFAKLLEEFQSADEELEVRKIKSRQNSVISELSSLHSDSVHEDEDQDDPEVEKEKMYMGVITFSTYRRYFRSGGNYFVIFLLIASFIISQASSNVNDYYITYWVNMEQDFADNKTAPSEQDEIRTNLMYQYTGITILTITMAIVHCEFIFIFLMRASVNLHNYIFEQLSKAKMKFFNANPTGRILNRFSKDLGIMDEYIPYVITDVCEVGLLLLGTIVLTSIVDPLLIAPAVVMMLFFYLMRIVYLRTSRSVKRIEGITRSPIFNQMTATMNGLSTIRAFSAQKILMKEFDNYQDLHSSAWFIFIASTRAFGFWIDLICVVFIAIIVFTLLNIKQDMYGGDMGLIITQYMGLMGALQWGMRQWSELENQMTSIERILEYTKLDNDPEREPPKALPEKWPNYGKLEFKNVSMRYLDDEPPVLKNLSFTVQAGEKVGIVGRTGAGKSSIIVSIFQLYEIEGSILIDDVDTTKLPLDIVRNKISIIPQEPILFSGTMRKNLDPFEEYNDDVLWNALEQVELKEAVAELPQGLQSIISEGGANFSVGQRQLVCLARAIIRNNKILVLDEATANVDPHTDSLIQKTIRRKFADFTVLTIAHRLHTVMDSDKIMVMDAGRALEFDSPYLLLQKDDGILKSMVENAGTNTAKNLKVIAEKTHEELKNK